jgi:hypothetical protein
MLLSKAVAAIEFKLRVRLEVAISLLTLLLWMPKIIPRGTESKQN